MDSETAYKLALLKALLDDLDAKITFLGQHEPLVSPAVAEMHIGVTQAMMVITEWQGK